MKTLEDFFAERERTELELSTGQTHVYYGHVPPIHLADGNRVSVQVGDGLYCTPRNDQGPWTHVEVGFPTAPPGPLWNEYCEDLDKPESTIYAYVPIELVRFYIGAHGGIKE